ncbi:MAG: FAD-binding oxidoreductase, partial [Hyphomicrobiales bacterium]|nr:FAD-binding oxidoreductase [Hyphomicrobiales bacterium]
EVKDLFDPGDLLNPGKIVRPPKMDDRRLMRYGPNYRTPELTTELDWSAWPGVGGGFQGAVEMCNNNGACRKSAGGGMCPSWRVTRDEEHVVRGRANTLRLAISGQLGPDAFVSDAMADAMKLCVSCKACRRECPTGVDMARMKIEVLAARAKKHGLSARDRMIGHLPSYAPYLAKARWLASFRDRVPGMSSLTERLFGLSSKRSLPVWAKNPFKPNRDGIGPESGSVVALFADTFNTWFEPEIVRDAIRVLVAGGHRVVFPKPADGSTRRLCCGRTFLSVGRVDLARREMERTATAFAGLAANGVPIVGLEPSCLLTFRDELLAILPGNQSEHVADNTFLLEEFLARGPDGNNLPSGRLKAEAHVHGHCHQKSFGIMGATTAVLSRIPGLEVKMIDSGCCGMAGGFGYQAETYDVSMQMAELSLLPAVRNAPTGNLIVACGTSCRHQIADGTGRRAMHPAQLLAAAIDEGNPPPDTPS